MTEIAVRPAIKHNNADEMSKLDYNEQLCEHQQKEEFNEDCKCCICLMNDWQKFKSEIGNIKELSKNMLYVKCSKCPYEGKQKYATDHYLKRHVHQNDVPYFCLLCQFKAFSPSQMDKHVTKICKAPGCSKLCKVKLSDTAYCKINDNKFQLNIGNGGQLVSIENPFHSYTHSNTSEDVHACQSTVDAELTVPDYTEEVIIEEIMINNARIGPIQTNQVQPAVRTSRIRALRILGGLQIGLGVVCGILGIVGAILSNTEMDTNCKQFEYYDNYNGHIFGYSYYHCGNADTIFIMDLIGMALSGWTIAFLVCNIISAVVFSSTVFSLAVVGALVASVDPNTGSVIAVSALLAVLSFIEFIISIVAAAHCCCCSQLNTGNQQRVIFINTPQYGMMYNMPNTQLPTGNQQEFHQMWMPQMQGHYVQQPTNMPNYQQQAGHLQGNQMPIQGFYGQNPQSFEMANQQQNINAQQFVHPTAPAVDTNQPFPVADNSIRSEM
ncbi:unnamed protein product [Mytilus coruscus]|uniref:C2H2-type domain-containing protein n=1 Tax=Mytilus coruscus TaxID=42192 RepID=A0A6J8CRC6_MYTCO|nr:unnamed protein product [Mytilus coruscus]